MVIGAFGCPLDGLCVAHIHHKNREIHKFAASLKASQVVRVWISKIETFHSKPYCGGIANRFVRKE